MSIFTHYQNGPEVIIDITSNYIPGEDNSSEFNKYFKIVYNKFGPSKIYYFNGNLGKIELDNSDIVRILGI